ncbi:MAG: S9 family peptidase [Bacteroidales bacterium]
MKTLSNSIILFFVIAFSVPVQIQSQEQVNDRKLTMDRIFASGEFRQEYFGNYQWYKGGRQYTVLERSDSIRGGMDIIAYDTKSGKSSVLVPATALLHPESGEPIRIASYSWSEDESKLLIFTNTRRVWRANTRGDYWVYELNEGKLYQLGADLPESSLMFAKFSPDGTKAAFVSKNNIYMQDLATGEVKQLTFDGTEDIINGTFDWVYEEELSCRDGFRWSPDGMRIAFWQLDATATPDFLMINNTDSLYSYTIPVQYPKAGEPPSLARVGYIETQSGKISWIPVPGEPADNYLPRMQWVDDNSLLIQQLNRYQNENHLWLFDLRDGSVNNFYTERDSAWVDVDFPDIAQSNWGMSDVPFLSNGRDFIWISERDGWRHLYRMSLDPTDNQVCLTRGDYDICTLYGIDEKNGYVYFNASPDNPAQRYLYRVNLDGSGGLTRLTPEEKSGVNLYDFSPDMSWAVETSQSLTRPRITDLVSLPKYKVTRHLVENKAYIEKMAGIDLGQTELFSVTTEDGIKMDGYMIKPPDFDPSKKYPVLFYVYGEPFGQTATDTWPNLWNEYLAQQGYIIMTLDNRGQPSPKGREWRKSIYKKIGVLNSRDQAMAAKEILKWDFVDPERIAVWGWSGGGSMTLNLLFRYPEIYKTGMAVAAVTNLRYYDNIYQERYNGLPQENPEVYENGSPVNFAGNLDGNLLYIHGTADDNVHYQNAEALLIELVKHGKKFTFMSYPNCSHGIYEIPGARRHLYTLMTDYLMEHVTPGGK